MGFISQLNMIGRKLMAFLLCLFLSLPSWAISGAAMDFDATDYISTPTLTFSPTASSILMWFNFDATGGVTASKSNNDSMWIYFPDATTVNVAPGDTPSTNFTVPTMSAGTWYHLAVTRNNDTLRVYLDGVESTTGGVTRTESADVNQFGRYFNGSSGFNYDGKLDDIRVYDRALSEAEVNTAMNCLNLPIKNLIARFDLPRVKDLSGNGNDATRQNSPTDITDGPPVSWCGKRN